MVAGLRRGGRIVSNPGMDAHEYARMDQVEAALWWYRALHQRLADALNGAGGPLLDAGCGTGGLLARLGRPDAIGLEYDAGAAARARAKSGAAVAGGSINALPFAERSFAAVVSADVLCHEGVDPARALAELWRVLRPGGRLVLNLPAYRWLLSAHDRRVHNARRVDAGELRAWLAEAGFVRPRLSYWNTLLLPAMIVRRKLLAGGSSDVALPPPWLNRLLSAILAVERRLRLPAGGSLLAIAERPLADGTRADAAG